MKRLEKFSCTWRWVLGVGHWVLGRWALGAGALAARSDLFANREGIRQNPAGNQTWQWKLAPFRDDSPSTTSVWLRGDFQPAYLITAQPSKGFPPKPAKFDEAALRQFLGFFEALLWRFRLAFCTSSFVINEMKPGDIAPQILGCERVQQQTFLQWCWRLDRSSFRVWQAVPDFISPIVAEWPHEDPATRWSWKSKSAPNANVSTTLPYGCRKGERFRKADLTRAPTFSVHGRTR
eukprot:s5_g13.t1